MQAKNERMKPHRTSTEHQRLEWRQRSATARELARQSKDHAERSTSTIRSRQRRRLAKETRCDPVGYSDLPLSKSIRSEIINELIAGGELIARHGADEVDMTTSQWRKKSGLLIAQYLIRMLVEKNGNALRYRRFLAFIIKELEEMS